MLLDMPIKLFAAGIALCSAHHIKCVSDIDVFTAAQEQQAHTVGVPDIGDKAYREAVIMCHEVIDIVHGRLTVRNDPSFDAIPLNSYQMVDGKWGTVFICQKSLPPTS